MHNEREESEVNSLLDVARSYLQRGWMPMPVPFRSKKPGLKGWQNLTFTEADLPQHFNGRPQNVGVLLGKASDNLVDNDLDAPEAVRLADDFMPLTGKVFGRDSKRRSHRLYSANVPTTKFEDIDGVMLLELRSTGAQTVFPGSTHPSGEKITWDTDGELAHVDGQELLRCAERLAAAVLLARHWPQEGSRQDVALALAGGLLRAGWPEDETAAFIEKVCRAAGDEETPERIKAPFYTLRKLDDGAHVTGWPTLAKVIDVRVIDRARKWLTIQSTLANDTHSTVANDENASEHAVVAWPELHPAALHGLAGDFVHLVEPHSEADPVALLVQFLIAFGNMVGRTAHFITEADKHFTNIFAVLVGGTGTGRKGTAWGHVKRIFESLDIAWARDCIAGGMSSGEGLIYSVRDAVISQKLIKADGHSTGVDGFVITDKGVTDKRLLVFEGEFASVLRAQGREGNTLSMVIRNLWDTGNARSMVKNAPTRTTGAHVSVIGHITRDELRSCLDAVESVNGYVNRFLWVCTRRSKFLPRGGRISTENFAPIIRRLRAGVEHVRTVGEMSFDEAAGNMWDAAYIGLETGRTGLLGKVTQRASPYVLRLSCLYALLDCSATVRSEHLEAALALWKYAEDSARYIFGERTGDRLADDLLRALREAEDTGLTRTDISNLFGRNVTAARISSALASLAETGLAYSRSERKRDAKRPVERWFATTQKPSTTNEFNEVNEFNTEGGGLNSSNSCNSYPVEDNSASKTEGEREVFEL
ncbi:MAG: bifunctional DNA primase/polymerase [Acidobacteriota bacterium]|nr:bifunctional DNA primase/polymerase [Acidobacteriota bacterium]